MEMKLKKSLIKNWWVAPAKEKMQFVNILNNVNNIEPDLVVMGYLHNEKDNLASSTNRVVKIIKEGVVTGQGTFYPFEEAHELYLKFLIEANEKNTVIANRWELIDEKHMVANLIWQIGIETIQNAATFDFKSTSNGKILLTGQSKELKSNIVLSPFNVRNQCLLLCVKDSVLKDIWEGSFATSEETKQKVKKIQQMF